MNRKIALAVGSVLLAGCASTNISQKDTLNERSDRLAVLDDRRPPNPNRPVDNRELKAVPVVVQQDPALNQPKMPARDDKGLAVNPGPDQHVRPQDPTQTEGAPNAVGGQAAQVQAGSVSSADMALATRVKDALASVRRTNSNIDPELASRETNGERKNVQNFEVTAKNGIVMLIGSVASEADRTALEQAASRVPGVQSVNNYLTVSKTEKQ